jgi:carbamoyl-phosphate synthase small subunit
MTKLADLLSGKPNAFLTLLDGTSFEGFSSTPDSETCGEIVFHTAMSGYQEVLTDPSYAEQFIVFTYPHIGNVGMNCADKESDRMYAHGLILAHKPTITSNYRSEESLEHFLKVNHKPCIYGIDTRALTEHIREHGSMGACIQTGSCVNTLRAIQKAKAFGSLADRNLAQDVSTKNRYEFEENVWDKKSEKLENRSHIIVLDFGVKKNILRSLVQACAKVTVLPYHSSLEDVLKHNPDGIVLSNGPGDPHACDHAIALTSQLLQRDIPLFGICLGHQIMALAVGAKTIRMNNGHHGANHPVKDLKTNLVDVTSQNHNFAVDDKGLPDSLEVTHRSLFDNTIQGLSYKGKPFFSMQGHPEACPGPIEHQRMFKEFMASVMQNAKNTF